MMEQLREILGKDIQSQHSKLEKADILEMAVKYLQQQKLHQNSEFISEGGPWNTNWGEIINV